MWSASARQIAVAASAYPLTTRGRRRCCSKSCLVSFWDSVKDSDNPALYQAYLEKYPEGNFASLATAKLEELEQTNGS